MNKNSEKKLINLAIKLPNILQSIPITQIDNQVFEKDSNDAHESLSLVHFKNTNFINLEYHFLDFTKCVFENCQFTNFFNAGFSECVFKNCTFDGLWVNHNAGIFKCDFHNLKATKNQKKAKIFFNDEASFYDTEFSDYNVKFLTSCIGFENNKSAITLQHHKFYNCKINLETIENISSEYSGFHCRDKNINHTITRITETGVFDEPFLYISTQNVKREVFINYIIAFLTHKYQFEIDNSKDVSIYPIKLTSSLKAEHINIFDNKGQEIDLTKIKPFDFDLEYNLTHDFFSYDLTKQNENLTNSINLINEIQLD